MSQSNITKVITTHQADDDIIVDYLMGNLDDRTELSPKLLEHIDRMHNCSDLIKKYGSRRKVVKMLASTIKKSDGSYISRSTAERVFVSTQRVLGTTSVHNRQYWFDVLLEHISEGIQLSKAAKDYRSFSSFTNQLKDLVTSLGSGDADLYDNIQPVPVEIGHFPELLKIDMPSKAEMEAQIKKLLKTKFHEDATDAEYA